MKVLPPIPLPLPPIGEGEAVPEGTVRLLRSRGASIKRCTGIDMTPAATYYDANKALRRERSKWKSILTKLLSPGSMA